MRLFSLRISALINKITKANIFAHLTVFLIISSAMAGHACDQEEIFNPTGGLEDSIRKLCTDDSEEFLSKAASMRGDFFKAVFATYNEDFLNALIEEKRRP
jgi:hypothetical protein